MKRDFHHRPSTTPTHPVLVDGKVCRCWSLAGGVAVVDIQVPDPQRMTTKIVGQHGTHAPTWKERQSTTQSHCNQIITRRARTHEERDFHHLPNISYFLRSLLSSSTSTSSLSQTRLPGVSGRPILELESIHFTHQISALFCHPIRHSR